MRAFIVVLLGALPASMALGGVACSSTTHSSASDLPDAGTTTPQIADAQTDGRSDTTTDAGAGDAGEVACKDWMERRVSGVCTKVPVATVSLGIAAGNDGGTRAVYQNQVCFYRPTTVAAPPAVNTQVIGACTVTTGALGGGGGGSVGYELFAGDIGVVTVSGGLAGSNVLRRSPTSNCYSSSLPKSALPFAGGETLSVSTTGGSDFPAASTSLTAPIVPELTALPKLVVGAPLSLSWSGARAGGTVDVTLSTSNATSFAYASCRVDNTGAYTFRAPVTAKLLSGSGSNTFVRIDNFASTRLEPAGSASIVQVYAAATDSRLLPP
jgi:hypothetical protein